jgi:hypothetical protein
MSLRHVRAGLLLAALPLVGCSHACYERQAAYPAAIRTAPACCTPGPGVTAAPVPAGVAPAPAFNPPPPGQTFGR